MVFDPRAEDALVVIRTNLFGAVISNTLSEECGDIIWLYRKYRSADDFIIKGFQIFRLFEHDIRCTFNLLDRPCIAKPKGLRDRAVTPGKDIQNLVESFRVDPVRKLLGRFYIGNFQKGVVVHTVTDLLPVQFAGKKVMPIHIKLKAERRPCWDAQIAEAKFFVNKIKIVVETFALVEL